MLFHDRCACCKLQSCYHDFSSGRFIKITDYLMQQDQIADKKNFIKRPEQKSCSHTAMQHAQRWYEMTQDVQILMWISPLCLFKFYRWFLHQS